MPSQALAQWQCFNLSYLPLRGQHWDDLYVIQTAPVSRLTLISDKQSGHLKVGGIVRKYDGWVKLA